MFLEESGYSPYDGTSFHQPPFVLMLFKIPIMMHCAPVICLLLDFWAAWLLYQITKLYNQTKEAVDDRTSLPPENMATMVALLYAFPVNPYYHLCS